MQLFYAPDITEPIYRLSEEEAIHSVKVMRLGKGSEIYLTDGCGTLYRGVIETHDRNSCEVRITERYPDYGKRDYGVTVAVAPTKNAERYEWFLEKATETGIDRIIPIECAHSERRVLKRDRGERIVTSAMKQSLKAKRPELDELTGISEVIGMGFEGVKMIAHCNAQFPRCHIGSMPLRGTDSLILIGPEGDFSAEEIAAAEAAGFVSVTLGDSRLRTETAALSVVTIIAFMNAKY